MLDGTPRKARKALTWRDQQQADRMRFLEDTRDHRLTIQHDDGLYRHITVAKPKCSAYHFHITTHPGYLTFTGDMGSFVFSRTRDMFEFHRINWGDKTPTIDYRYWAEKACAVDRNSGTDDFDDNHFREAALRDFWTHEWPDQKTRRDEWATEIRRLIEAGHHTSAEAIHCMMEFSYERHTQYEWGGTRIERVHPFSDFYEHGPFTKPGFRLKWACWAIAYTIRDYDLGGDRFTRQSQHDALVLKGAL